MKEKGIVILIKTPYVTKKVFEELTGLSISSINRMIRDGRLLVVKAAGEKGGILINMYDYTRKATQQVQELENKIGS